MLCTDICIRDNQWVKIVSPMGVYGRYLLLTIAGISNIKIVRLLKQLQELKLSLVISTNLSRYISNIINNKHSSLYRIVAYSIVNQFTYLDKLLYCFVLNRNYLCASCFFFLVLLIMKRLMTVNYVSFMNYNGLCLSPHSAL